MKKIMIITACLLIGLTAYSQQQHSDITLDSLDKIKDPVALNQKLKMLGSGSEEDLSLLMIYYRESEKSRDSVEQIAVRKFPEGQIAFEVRGNEVRAEKDLKVKEQMVGQLKKDFPKGDFGSLNLMLAYDFANTRNTVKALEYLADVKGIVRPYAMKIIAEILMGYDLKAAEAVVVQELGTPNLNNEERMILLNVYSYILSKKGDYKNAFAAVKEYYDHTPEKSPELNAHYYYLLSKTGDYKNAFPGLEKAAIEGLANDNLKQELKSSFVKLNPGKDVNKYLLSINKQLEEHYKKKVIDQMIDEVSPNFKVTDVNGKVVSLTDFKGKTIVLDFWATWCGPCKRSLPAMQMVVNKYKDDHNVKFLFIHTWESVPNAKADAMKYLADNKYNLPLYMDLKDPVTEKNPAVSLFDVAGIPAKFVIDGNGHIRFKLSGFGGTNDVAVAELSAMIELSRKSN